LPTAFHESLIVVFDDSDEFADGSVLDYTDHELTDEQLAEITEYFAK